MISESAQMLAEMKRQTNLLIDQNVLLRQILNYTALQQAGVSYGTQLGRQQNAELQAVKTSVAQVSTNTAATAGLAFDATSVVAVTVTDTFAALPSLAARVIEGRNTTAEVLEFRRAGQTDVVGISPNESISLIAAVLASEWEVRRATSGSSLGISLIRKYRA